MPSIQEKNEHLTMTHAMVMIERNKKSNQVRPEPKHNKHVEKLMRMAPNVILARITLLRPSDLQKPKHGH